MLVVSRWTEGLDPEAERVYEATANADTVDGFSAIGATANKALRARKLVATNRYGQLPSNIIRPRWRDLKGVPASFNDNVIGWYEVQNKPAGFADDVDNAGVTGVTLTRVAINDVPVPAGTTKLVEVFCPGGSRVTGGGFWTSSTNDFNLIRSQPRGDLSGWSVDGYNRGGAQLTMSAFAVCMTAPGGTVTVATKG